MATLSVGTPPRTPGVYVQEIPTFPPSVAEVSTAIPAFLGYTEKGSGVARINTLLEYETLFGKAFPSTFTVTTRMNSESKREEVARIDRTTADRFLLYYSLSLYFKNGGGSCYVVSLGHYTAPLDQAEGRFTTGLADLAKEDEPTLILLTDAVNLSASVYYSLCNAALQQCHDMGDRFAILDVLPERPGSTDPARGVTGFRNNITNSLRYGAAYYPYLKTSLSYQYNPIEVQVVSASAGGAPALTWTRQFGDNNDGITVTYTGHRGDRPAVEITAGQSASETLTGGFATRQPPTVVLAIDVSVHKTGEDIAKAWPDWKLAHPGTAFNIEEAGKGNVPLTTSALLAGPHWSQDFGAQGITITYMGQEADTPAVTLTLGQSGDPLSFDIDADNKALTIRNVADKNGKAIVEAWGKQSPVFSITAKDGGNGPVPATRTLADIESTDTTLYNQIKAALNQQWVELPPSAAVAGVYAQVDRDRGVWKAPANVSLAAVIGPVTKISHKEQEDLNDAPGGTGKSINAIREFTGKGTLVWGARTLAGNDNEWRYVPVRRLFNMIEESVYKATAFAVFEPNDATTWLKVKAMIDSFLYGLWERGALAGSTPKAAYFVHVGLGKTMTPQDILEGRMIVAIGVAAVRPAEFIILRFSHKMQEA